MANVTLTQLTDDDREQFILDNQRAFKFGAMEEFGNRDDHMEEDGEIISRKTIEDSIDGGVAYRIREDGRIVGGLVLTIDKETQHNHLDLLFVTPDAHSKGIGYAAWQEASWSSLTAIIRIRTIRKPAKRTITRGKISMVCSDLRSE